MYATHDPTTLLQTEKKEKNRRAFFCICSRAGELFSASAGFAVSNSLVSFSAASFFLGFQSPSLPFSIWMGIVPASGQISLLCHTSTSSRPQPRLGTSRCPNNHTMQFYLSHQLKINVNSISKHSIKEGWYHI